MLLVHRLLVDAFHAICADLTLRNIGESKLVALRLLTVLHLSAIDAHFSLIELLV